jgi:CRP/FNR family cyclic AMP-dependent transcriptional regulator
MGSGSDRSGSVGSVGSRSGGPVRDLERWRLHPAARPRLRWFRDGQAIFHQGDSGSALYLVISGAVAVTALCPAGREAVLGLLGPGQAFGHGSLVARPHRGTARAFGHCLVEVVDLPGSAARPDVAAAFGPGLARAPAARCEALEEWLADLVLLDVPARLAKRLCDLIDGFGQRQAGGILIDLPVTQGQLASLVGATRESVNRALGSLVADGVVRRLDRRYLVTDQRALRRLAGRHGDAAGARPRLPSTG